MPQTRFVLRKAFAAGLTPIVVINKCDRPDARIEEVINEVLETFIDTTEADDDDSILEFPIVYASAKNGWATLDREAAEAGTAEGVEALLDVILDEVPPPRVEEGSLQMLVSSLDYDDYVGRIAVGRVRAGRIEEGKPVLVCHRDGKQVSVVPKAVQTYQGLGRVATTAVEPGDIAALVGFEGIDIGASITSPEDPRPLPPVSVDEPTVAMLFGGNDGPLRGTEGTYVSSRQVRERLEREARRNVSIRVSDTASPDTLEVAGRGVLHLGILVETMRREGFEFTVSRPEVIVRTDPETGERLEPVEVAIVDVPTEHSGKAIELLCGRRGELIRMDNRGGNMVRIELNVPSRGLIGVRTKLLNATSGEAVLNHQFLEYASWKGELPRRSTGVQVSGFLGEVTTYAVDLLQGRGPLFVGPGDRAYEGMICGEHVRDDDIVVNICRKRKLDNMRAATADKKIVLTPPRRFGVEEALEYIADDELVEVTPKSLRLRKKLLGAKDRKKADREEREAS